MGVADLDGCEAVKTPELVPRGDTELLNVEDCEANDDTEALEVIVLALVPLRYPLPEVDAHAEVLIDIVTTGLSLT